MPDNVHPNQARLYPQYEFFSSSRTGLGVEETLHPKTVIHTRYPVWRARHLPFGYGVLSLPQRGETQLEMWSPAQADTPVFGVEGHTDVVKEYVWRSKGGTDMDFGEDRPTSCNTAATDRSILKTIESSNL